MDRKDELDQSNTQRGKHIVIYYGEITPYMLMKAKRDKNRESICKIAEICAEVRKLYFEIDAIMYNLMNKGLVHRGDYFSSDGVGGDKILSGAQSRMIGYRIGAYCTDFIVVVKGSLDTYGKKKYNYVKTVDRRDLYKQIEAFTEITLTTKPPVARPEHRDRHVEHRDRRVEHIEAQDRDHKRQCRIIFDFASRIYKKGHIMFPMGVMIVARPVAIGEKTIERDALQMLSQMVVDIIDKPENAKLVGNSPRAAYYFYADIILEDCTTLETGLVNYLKIALDQCMKHRGENGTFVQLKRVIRDILGVA